ncbi:MAG: hypothetical protein JWM58_2322 [Rhizobium sp.]|nr:hypothetical protein [Rhizobium sp.]
MDFNIKRADLERAGFPKPMQILGNYDIHAIDAWIDAETGGAVRVGQDLDEAEMLRRIAKM